MNNKGKQDNLDNQETCNIVLDSDNQGDAGGKIEDYYLTEVLSNTDESEETNQPDAEEQLNIESTADLQKLIDGEPDEQPSDEKAGDDTDSDDNESGDNDSEDDEDNNEAAENHEASNQKAVGVSADLQPDDEIPEKEEGVDYGLKNKDYYDLDTIVARITERKKAAKDKKKDKIIRTRLIAGGIALAIALLIFSFTDVFTVDNIVVEGNKYFSAEEIINMGHASPGKNIIYQSDKGTIVDYLEANPYIKKAKVRRRLPSTLVIRVEERIQAAAIRYEDEYLIIDREGTILRKTRTTPKITIIEGLVIRKMKVGEKIIVKDEALLERALNLLNLMKEHDLYFVRLNMTGRYIKAYIYESLVCKGTYQQIVSAVEENKLHRVLEEIFDDGIRRGTITFSDEGYISYEPAIY